LRTILGPEGAIPLSVRPDLYRADIAPGRQINEGNGVCVDAWLTEPNGRPVDDRDQIASYSRPEPVPKLEDAELGSLKPLASQEIPTVGATGIEPVASAV
jgi:hypothetical protein